MDIAGYIKEFLLLQNNVRVPELGSFLIKNQSAIIDEAKKTITPPSKAVLFEENRKTGDQLFIKFLAGKEGITEEDALKSISEFTTEVKAKLQSDGFITFPGFGKFEFDNSRQIQFEPFFTEFLSAEIYGLDTLTDITPIQEPVSKIIDEKEKTGIKVPEPVPAPAPVQVSVPAQEEQPESDENEDKKNHFARILVFSLIPLILVCAAIIWAINMGYVSNAKFDFSKVNFNFSSLFQKKVTPVVPKPIVLGPKPVDSSKIANNGEDSMNDQQRALFYHENKTQEKEPEQTAQNQDVQKDQSTVPSQKKEIKKETKKDKTTEKVEEKASSKIKADTNKTSSDKKYYIIAGSFKKLSFAKNLRQELEKNGFHAEVLTVDSQTFRVALGSFRSKDSANKELKKLKVLKNSDTYWLYSK